MGLEAQRLWALNSRFSGSSQAIVLASIAKHYLFGKTPVCLRTSAEADWRFVLLPRRSGETFASIPRSGCGSALTKSRRQAGHSGKLRPFCFTSRLSSCKAIQIRIRRASASVPKPSTPQRPPAGASDAPGDDPGPDIRIVVCWLFFAPAHAATSSLPAVPRLHQYIHHRLRTAGSRAGRD